MVLPILDLGKPSPHRITSSAYQTGQILNYNKTRNDILPPSVTNGSGGVSPAKPRRLESLSYGLKGRSASNSIPFEEEDEEISNSAASSNSVKSKKLKDVPDNQTSASTLDPQHVRKTTLQIRRDLSRLVASVGAGIVDDDATSGNSKLQSR